MAEVTLTPAEAREIVDALHERARTHEEVADEMGGPVHAHRANRRRAQARADRLLAKRIGQAAIEADHARR